MFEVGQHFIFDFRTDFKRNNNGFHGLRDIEETFFTLRSVNWLLHCCSGFTSCECLHDRLHCNQ
jgi:hypothetical protein